MVFDQRRKVYVLQADSYIYLSLRRGEVLERCHVSSGLNGVRRNQSISVGGTRKNDGREEEKRKRLN